MNGIVQYRLWLSIQHHRLRAEALREEGRHDEVRASEDRAGRCLRVLLRAAQGRRAG